MYACLYAPTGPREEQLLVVASQFSPEVELASPQAVLFSLTGLTRLLGSPAQIVAAIEQVAEQTQLPLQLAVASNPDSALLLAHHGPEPVLLPLEEEQVRLARLPLATLFAHESSADPQLLTLLQNWGAETCGELAALPEQHPCQQT